MGKTAANARYFIDGTNVIRTNLSLAKIETERGGEAAREALLRLIERRSSNSDADWTVVFDGGRTGAADVERRGDLTIRYAWDRSADEIVLEDARNALAVGAETIVVSSDQALHLRGAHAVLAQDFYEDLLRKKAPSPARADAGAGARLLAYLAERGVVDEKTARDAALGAALSGQLDYFSHGRVAPVKLARRVEPFLREHAAVRPDPDPEKKVLRALKSYFSGDAP